MFTIIRTGCLYKGEIQKIRDYCLSKHGYRLIIGGGFNAKHTHLGSRKTTTKGKELLTLTATIRQDKVMVKNVRLSSGNVKWQPCWQAQKY